jgi:hypothetical protein
VEVGPDLPHEIRILDKCGSFDPQATIIACAIGILIINGINDLPVKPTHISINEN